MAVAENLSFSKAAKELFISQPAVSKHIKELEAKLQTTLIERKSNRIYLTNAGELTYNHLKIINQQYANLEFEIGRLNDTFKGKLQIGASSTISQYVLPKAIAAFHKRYPKIEFHLFNGNSFEMEQKLLDNDVDLVLVENESSHPDLKYMDLIQDNIVVVSGKTSPYAKRKSLSPMDFQQIPIVLREKGSGTLEVIQKSLKKNKIDLNNLNILVHLGSTEAIKNFLDDFDGIALISEQSIKKELELKSLSVLTIKGIEFKRHFRIALRHGSESMTAKLFINFLATHNF